ncbi:hypothetical protein TSAR_008418 [Trichomalopsis sarcophagae]|uniref:Uncharacterized protein n=1 Tax=Trichomalopsis sarcophagae TaxID=543379 RepID=A0A232FKH5_9HYME|nr:hypothetical protein TSAR_008418 [Trichomalopsis sarcophagae]
MSNRQMKHHIIYAVDKRLHGILPDDPTSISSDTRANSSATIDHSLWFSMRETHSSTIKPDLITCTLDNRKRSPDRGAEQQSDSLRGGASSFNGPSSTGRPQRTPETAGGPKAAAMPRRRSKLSDPWFQIGEKTSEFDTDSIRVVSKCKRLQSPDVAPALRMPEILSERNFNLKFRKGDREKQRWGKKGTKRLAATRFTNMHLKENKITYFSPFGPRDRPLCSADKMKKLPCTQFQLIQIQNILTINLVEGSYVPMNWQRLPCTQFQLIQIQNILTINLVEGSYVPMNWQRYERTVKSAYSAFKYKTSPMKLRENHPKQIRSAMLLKLAKLAKILFIESLKEVIIEDCDYKVSRGLFLDCSFK